MATTNNYRAGAFSLFFLTIALLAFGACKKSETDVPGNVERITLITDYEMGYGGYYYYVYKPWVFFKDGTFVKEPRIPIDELVFATLNAELATNWGTWELSGSEVKLTYRNGKTGTKEWPGTAATAARKGETLDGKFSAISGGGNLAWGGDVGILSYSRMAFISDGKYTTERIDGSNSSSHAAYHTNTTSGNYRFDGDYSITLTANNGQTKRFFFCWFSNAEKHFRLAGRTFSRNSD